VNTPVCLIAAANARTLEVQSIWDFIVKGGLMMIPIGICSFIALTVVVERLISLRRGAVVPPAFLRELREALGQAPADWERGLEHCRNTRSPLANVFAAGIRRLDRGPQRVEQAIQEAGEREALRLRKFLRVLSVIAAVAPLLGLLGTILGMIRAFQTVAASADALGKTEMLAGGIYEAMITTAAGLVVAIPTLVCFHWISGKVDGIVADMDRMTVEFLEEFVERPGAGGAAPESPAPGLRAADVGDLPVVKLRAGA
jgi:biopolymer transport protein ExbB